MAHSQCEVHLHHFFKDKKAKRSHKTVGIKVFLTIFAWWQKGPDPDPYLRLVDPDPGGPKTCGSGGSGLGSVTLVTSKQILHLFRLIVAAGLVSLFFSLGVIWSRDCRYPLLLSLELVEIDPLLLVVLLSWVKQILWHCYGYRYALPSCGSGMGLFTCMRWRTQSCFRVTT